MTAVGIDVGGRRKGFHGCALRGDEVVAGPERLRDVASAVEWVVALEPTCVALDSPKTCAPPGESSRQESRAKWSATALLDLGLAGLPSRRFNQDDRDAVAAASVARLHTEGEGRTEAFGEIIVPAGPPWG